MTKRKKYRKYNEEIIRNIMGDNDDGITISEISKKYNIPHNSIKWIVQRELAKKYNHIHQQNPCNYNDKVNLLFINEQIKKRKILIEETNQEIKILEKMINDIKNNKAI